MKEKKPQNDKDNKSLVEADSDDMAADVMASESRQDRMIRLLCTGLPVCQAAVQAGYSEAYSNTGVYSMIRRPAFQKRMKDYVLAVYKTSAIPSILSIDNKVLEYLKKNPLDSRKYGATLKRVQKVTGFLGDEFHPSPPVLNIGSMTVIQQGLAGHFKRLEYGTNDDPRDVIDVQSEGDDQA